MHQIKATNVDLLSQIFITHNFSVSKILHSSLSLNGLRSDKIRNVLAFLVICITHTWDFSECSLNLNYKASVITIRTRIQ